MLGLKCRVPSADVVRAGYDARVLVVGAADNVVRLLPPLNLSEAEADEGLRAARAGGGGGGGGGGRVRHFLDLHLTPADELRAIIEHARAMKAARGDAPKGVPDAERPLYGRVVALVFEKPSTRTRVSFDVGIRQMGGETLVLSGAEMQLGHGETIADTARVLSRFVDAIMIRTFEESVLQEMAEFGLRAGDQRPDQRQPPLPDHGRRDDLRGAPRADRGQEGGLVGRRQQRLRLLAARRRPVRLRPGLHRAGGARPRARGRRLRPSPRRDRRDRARPAEGGRRRRPRGHRHLDLDARQPERPRAPARAAAPLPGQRSR